MLICKMTEDKIRGPLTPAQRVWLGPRTAPESTKFVFILILNYSFSPTSLCTSIKNGPPVGQ
ncbi:hypothetical protein GBAR_LOCUS1232 [Geodia barretti]|uniref:Uncharacterized protein n=1 Tax=Geodia barretti TaxID=519541 RepID=A0AA35QVD3_GEOBA|nr:hypothetical protein GBAR_LOCUS1232 [Geodia barretti]